ncbi:MAG TPA: LacI family DNA-binding transcriptional regulator [Candidatus Solibacter sp.]|nr:LacI family DNA-binding transcriptional regulator [Candidatus Solibacter sp.]
MPIQKTANLKDVANRVGLAPCSVSAVLNCTPASWAIPQHTRDRVFRAAAELNYQPSFTARSLRSKRTHLVAVVSRDFGKRTVGQIVAGMERHLRDRGYLLALAVIEDESDWGRLASQLQQRGIEGVVAVDSTPPREFRVPLVSVRMGSLAAMGDESDDRLAEFGETISEALLAKVEGKTEGKNADKPSARRTRIVPEFLASPALPLNPMVSARSA